MPGVNPPANQWFAVRLAQMEADIRALKAQRTQYVVDASGASQAIIGNLATDPNGNPTGLTGFGVAVLVGGEWVDASGQPGDLVSSAADARPGCLLCDGTSYATATYSALFAVIGYAYGGSGANFKVPDLRGRAGIGAGTGPGLSARSLGQVGGEEAHLLLSGESGLPSASTGTDTPDHAHVAGGGYSNFIVQNGPVTNIGLSLVSGGTDAATPDTGGATARHAHAIGPANAGSAHNNMQPFAVVNWFIKT